MHKSPVKNNTIGGLFLGIGILLSAIKAAALCSKQQHAALSEAHHDAYVIARQFYEDIDHVPITSSVWLRISHVRWIWPKNRIGIAIDRRRRRPPRKNAAPLTPGAGA
jgi:hypothetical protein